METRGQYVVVGDYGNPDGTGAAQVVMADIPYSANEVADAQTALQTFHAAIVAADLSDAVFGDCNVSIKSENFPAKPVLDCNVDRILVVGWRTKQDSSPRKNTLPGVPLTSANITKYPEGERLNDAGKLVVAAALAALYKITAPDEVIVKWGKVLTKQ